MDETYIKLKGKWVYLYCAADSQGDTSDFLLIAKRDAVAAKDFFKKAIKHNGRRAKVTIGKSGSNKVALDFWNQGIAENEKIKIRKSNALTVSLSKIIALSRREPDQCWVLKVFK